MLAFPLSFTIYYNKGIIENTRVKIITGQDHGYTTYAKSDYQRYSETVQCLNADHIPGH
jgi:hypothetical protein